MTREEQKGWWCSGCERIRDMTDLTCRCMNLLPEHQCAGYRRKYWKVAVVKFSVSMESANR